jgi:stress-induced morphogen
MNNRLTRNALHILMESPFYPGLSLKDRHRLVSDFIALYSSLIEGLSEEHGTEEQNGPSA